MYIILCVSQNFDYFYVRKHYVGEVNTWDV